MGPKPGLICPTKVEAPSLNSWWMVAASTAAMKKQRQILFRGIRIPIQQMLRLVLPDFASNKRDHLPFPFVGEAPSGFCGYLRQERGIEAPTPCIITSIASEAL